MVARAGWLILLVLFPWSALQAALSARFDRDTVHLNETVRLVIESDDPANRSQPDLSAVERHFRILGQSSSRNISVVNGKQSSTLTWTLELEPRDIGSFSLDPIRLGGEQTTRLRINILPGKKLAAGGELFVEAELDSTEVYVQQQVVLSVRMFFAVPLIDGAVGDPEVSDAMVRRLGDDRNYSVTREGRTYRVFERRFALFPQSSGELQIPPLRFQGRVDEGGRGVFGSLMNSGRRVRAASEPLSVHVKPPAITDPSLPWVPARALQLVDLSDPVDGYTVGQPVTRKIQLQALGLTAEQLPEIHLPQSDGMRFYPDQPVLDTQNEGDDTVGIQLQRIAVIPGQSGELTLPGLEVHWWNTDTDSPEIARLEPRRIQVAPATDGGPLPPPVAAEDTAQPDAAPLVTSGGNPAPASETRWKWVALAAMGLWLVTALTALVWLALRRKRGRASAHEPAETPGAEWWRRFRRACQENDPVSARRALSGWARVAFPSTGQLDELARSSGSEALAREIDRLHRELYAPDGTTGQWTGSDLWAACRDLPKTPANPTRSRRNPLQPLYPD